MKRLQEFSVLSLALVLSSAPAAAQKIETVNNVRIIHNEKVGQWGNKPEVSLELVRTIGGLDVQDENLAFRAPYDIVLDSSGNMYVLDSGNSRIQKLNPEGKFIKTIGGRGQAPGEFRFPFSMDIDERDRLYVYDSGNLRIQVLTPDGGLEKTLKVTRYSQNQIRLMKSGQIVMGRGLGAWMDVKDNLPQLVEVIDQDGKRASEFGDARNYKDMNINSFANTFNLDKDASGNICLSFLWQNRIEKYSADGRLQWRADRILNYGTDVVDKGFVERDDSGTTIQQPEMNAVSMGLSVDAQSRIWVITLSRQMSKEEEGVVISGGGVHPRMEDSKAAKLDVYELEIYSPEGILLGKIPLAHHAHGIRICGGLLFIWERATAAYYQYKILEKQN